MSWLKTQIVFKLLLFFFIVPTLHLLVPKEILAASQDCRRFFKSKDYLRASQCYQSLSPKTPSDFCDEGVVLNTLAKNQQNLKERLSLYQRSVRSFWVCRRRNPDQKQVADHYLMANQSKIKNIQKTLQERQSREREKSVKVRITASLQEQATSIYATYHIQGQTFQKSGKLPLSTSLKPGKYQISIRYLNAKVLKTTITITPQEPYSKHFQLAPIIQRDTKKAPETPSWIWTTGILGGVSFLAGAGIVALAFYNESKLNDPNKKALSAKEAKSARKGLTWQYPTGGVLAGLGIVGVSAAILLPLLQKPSLETTAYKKENAFPQGSFSKLTREQF